MVAACSFTRQSGCAGRDRLREIISFDDPCLRPGLESRNCLAVDRCREKKSSSREPGDDTLPQPHDGEQLAGLISELVLVPKRVPAVFRYYHGKLAVKIVAADSESVWRNIDLIEEAGERTRGIFQFDVLAGRDPGAGKWHICGLQ
jgi:hypothetical protein